MRRQIDDGHWEIGSKVPGRRDLAKRYDVDITTIQRAMSALLDDGTLTADGRRGTYVRKSSLPTTGSPSANGERLPKTLTLGITAFMDEDGIASGTELPATLTIVKAIENYAASFGAKARFLNRWQRSGEELLSSACAKQLIDEGADTAIIVDAYTHPRVITDIRTTPGLNDLPVVYVSTVGEYVPCTHVYYDNRDAGLKAADALLSQGYRDITFLAPYIGDWQSMRIDGATIACERFRHGASLQVVPHAGMIDANDGPNKEEQIQEFLIKFIQSGMAKVGIIAAHDVLAYRLMELANEQGLTAGSDYGLVGFDDEPLAFSRGLTTIRPPFEDIGAEAARLAFALSTDKGKNLVASLRPQLVARKTHERQSRNPVAIR